MRLDRLPLRESALITAVDWDSLSAEVVQRLRDSGIVEGETVEATHCAAFAGDPIACTIGGKTYAIRRDHAAAVEVEQLAR
ncbi:ferrous iron transport protein A [Parasphingopyxis sp. CP4]|uniref:FeoA family protein n=1 Tax=Parasphingopyxis sp. CP4 TaxID=2724527 RepID=UPI0015A3D350|nr:FeoA family protein [Parasphingopyxis sp. CP4]QLC22644.1 ferrous iron transport protein A [Parasphingopyxis sp. CP4]